MAIKALHGPCRQLDPSLKRVNSISAAGIPDIIHLHIPTYMLLLLP